jgi:hypothetical protein
LTPGWFEDRRQRSFDRLKNEWSPADVFKETRYVDP